MQRKIGWALSGLAIAFLLFDAMGKFAKPQPVVQAMAATGWPIALAGALGTILLVCTVLYAVPKTALLGAILVTGYLGGAVATNLRLGEPLLSHTLFPVYFGVLVWLGLWLRAARLRGVFPILR